MPVRFITDSVRMYIIQILYVHISRRNRKRMLAY